MRRSPLMMIFLTIFIDLVGFGIIIPVLPFYTRSFGADAFVLGALLASYSLTQFLAAPILGRLSDRVGRKPVLALSMLGTAVASAMMGLAHNWMGLPLLFVARLLDGATGGNISTAQAYIADVTPPEKRAMGMGLIGMAFGLGFVLGPAIGGILARRFDVTTPFYVVAVVALLNAIAMWRFLPEPERHVAPAAQPKGRARELVEALERRETAIPIVVFFLSTYAFANLEATLTLLAADRYTFNSEQAGYLFAYTGLLLAVVQGGIVRRLAPRYGEQILVVLGMLTTALGLVMVGVAGHLPLLLAALALLALGQGISNPSLSSLVSRLSAKDKQGASLGLTQSMGSLGRIAGPITGGYLYSHAGMSMPYYFGGGMMLVACGLAAYHKTLVRLPIAGSE